MVNWIKLTFSLLFLLVLSGCWDRIELNELSIVSGIAIEKGEEHKYKLTVEVINATELSKDAKGGNTPALVYYQEGNSISELSDKMNIGLSRVLIYSHTRVIVIDEEVAREGMAEFLDFLERTGEFRNDFNILIAKDVKASEILKITYAVQRVPSLKLHAQIEAFEKDWGGDPDVKLTDFISAIVNKGRQPVAEAVTIRGNINKGQSIDNNKKVDPDARVEIVGLAVFSFDKLVGYLTVEDIRNYLWTKKLKTTTLTIPCSADNSGKYIDVKIVSAHSKKNVEWINDSPVIKVNISGDARLQGTQCIEDLEKLATYNQIEESTNQFIEEEIKRTIKKVQEKYGVDIFGFGEELKRKNYKKYKELENNWDEQFERAEVEVSANIYIRRSGIRSKSFLTDYINEQSNE